MTADEYEAMEPWERHMNDVRIARGDQPPIERPQAGAQASPGSFIEHSTACEHSYRDCGIQPTGERVIRCSKCWHGFELQPDVDPSPYLAVA